MYSTIPTPKGFSFGSCPEGSAKRRGHGNQLGVKNNRIEYRTMTHRRNNKRHHGRARGYCIVNPSVWCYRQSGQTADRETAPDVAARTEDPQRAEGYISVALNCSAVLISNAITERADNSLDTQMFKFFVASSLWPLVYVLRDQNAAPKHIDNLHTPARTYR
jgi:hypothetical protein